MLGILAEHGVDLPVPELAALIDLAGRDCKKFCVSVSR
jgi:hypothetical protein